MQYIQYCEEARSNRSDNSQLRPQIKQELKNAEYFPTFSEVARSGSISTGINGACKKKERMVRLH